MKSSAYLRTHLLISIVFVAISGTVVAEEIVYVDDSAMGTNNGSSWTNAYNYLQNALTLAAAGDEIRVAQGIYRPDQGAGMTSGDRTASFELKNGLALKGGYGGFGEPDPNVRDVGAYATILSGDLNRDDIDVDDPSDQLTEPTRAENSYSVVTATYTDANTVLDGFTITAGQADGSYPYDRGGGIYIDESSPMVSNCTFERNIATFAGGATHNWGNGSPTFASCVFARNSADSGGGVYSWTSSPLFSDCEFSRNSADDSGGAMINWNNSPTLRNCTFRGNRATRFGGGVVNNFSDPSIEHCTFSDNSATLAGGGIDNYYSNPKLSNCSFVRNSSYQGGGMYNAYSNPELTSCNFGANRADFFGGGIFNGYESSPILRNCTFKRNRSNQGGGMFNSDSSAMLTNCVFGSNLADAFGGGMYNLYSSSILINCTLGTNSALFWGGALCVDGSYTSMTNCVLWGNTARLGPEVHLRDSSNLFVTFCDVCGGRGLAHVADGDSSIDWGPGNIDVEPLLTPDGHLRSDSLDAKAAGNVRNHVSEKTRLR